MKNKVYAVAVGKHPGSGKLITPEEGGKIYKSWDDCKRAVDHVSNARYRSFATEEEAKNWINELKKERKNSNVDKNTKNNVQNKTKQTKNIANDNDEKTGLARNMDIQDDDMPPWFRVDVKNNPLERTRSQNKPQNLKDGKLFMNICKEAEIKPEDIQEPYKSFLMMFCNTMESVIEDITKQKSNKNGGYQKNW